VNSDQQHVDAYLSKLRTSLGRLDDGEREEIVREIRDHIADARSAGRDIAEILAALGPADQLARAYTLEHVLYAPKDQMGGAVRALTLIGLLVVISLPSFVVCVALGSLGFALTVSGVAVFGAGVVELVRPGTIPDLTVSPWLCLLIGPALLLGAGAALSGLYFYVRSIIRLTLRTLNRVRSDSRPA
jgi:uncharacterized membrane protein